MRSVGATHPRKKENVSIRKVEMPSTDRKNVIVFTKKAPAPVVRRKLSLENG